MFRRLVKLSRVLRGETLVLWYAFRHPATPMAIKLGVVLLAAYLVNPIDAITDLLPLVGWADDLALLALGVPWLLKRVPPAVRAEADARARATLSRWRFGGVGR